MVQLTLIKSVNKMRKEFIQVNQEECIGSGCSICFNICPDNAIIRDNGKAFIDQTRCSLCEKCVDACPQNAIYIVEEEIGEHDIQTRETGTINVPQPPTVQIMKQAAAPLAGTALFVLTRELLPRIGNLIVNMTNKPNNIENTSNRFINPNQARRQRPYRLRRRRHRR